MRRLILAILEFRARYLFKFAPVEITGKRAEGMSKNRSGSAFPSVWALVLTLFLLDDRPPSTVKLGCVCLYNWNTRPDRSGWQLLKWSCASKSEETRTRTRLLQKETLAPSERGNDSHAGHQVALSWGPFIGIDLTASNLQGDMTLPSLPKQKSKLHTRPGLRMLRMM